MTKTYSTHGLLLVSDTTLDAAAQRLVATTASALPIGDGAEVTLSASKSVAVTRTTTQTADVEVLP
jgi:hypothetical protein